MSEVKLSTALGDAEVRARAKAVGDEFLRGAFEGGPIVTGLSWESVTVALAMTMAGRSGIQPEAALGLMMQAAQARLQLVQLDAAVPAGRA